MLLKGKVVLVTGASRGIGRALARGFAADGAEVVVFARSADALQQTTGGDTEHFLAVAGDVTSEADVDRLVAAACQRFGHIDVLVNNAGMADVGTFLRQPFQHWAEVIRVNLIGLALCTYRVLPGMVERGYGRVINVVSRAAEFPQPMLSAYAASKAGLVSFNESLAADIGPPTHPDILINALLPGPVDTEMYREGGLDPTQAQPPEAVYPHARFLVLLPPGGPHGRVFWNSHEYKMHDTSNATPTHGPSQARVE
jgi:NAD(P)-dependent dehydrogenase (short-subunit alcohol dehydrogenase family)